jgi:hypothetical protein
MKSYSAASISGLAAALTAAAVALGAQMASTHVKVPAIAAQPQDVDSPEAIVRASFDVESGPVGAPRDWARQRTLYDPAGSFVATGRDPVTGALQPRRRTFQEYVDMMDEYSVHTGFVDKPLGCITNKRKYVASVTCGYEGREGSKVTERGVDIFQLYNDGQRWWILSVVWDKEEPGNPIPVELLSGE